MNQTAGGVTQATNQDIVVFRNEEDEEATLNQTKLREQMLEFKVEQSMIEPSKCGEGSSEEHLI
jgi:hypothetical protein